VTGWPAHSPIESILPFFLLSTTPLSNVNGSTGATTRRPTTSTSHISWSTGRTSQTGTRSQARRLSAGFRSRRETDIIDTSSPTALNARHARVAFRFANGLGFNGTRPGCHGLDSLGTHHGRGHIEKDTGRWNRCHG
jgi:hypothetical protein